MRFVTAHLRMTGCPAPRVLKTTVLATASTVACPPPLSLRRIAHIIKPSTSLHERVMFWLCNCKLKLSPQHHGAVSSTVLKCESATRRVDLSQALNRPRHGCAIHGNSASLAPKHWHIKPICTRTGVACDPIDGLTNADLMLGAEATACCGCSPSWASCTP